MGLDVYLYKANKQKLLVAERQEKKFEKYSEKKWKEKEGIIFKKDRDILSTELEKKALSMWLNKWGGIPDEIETLVELPSTKYPEHMFKIGYFRSSYNDSGVNNILRQITGEDLYDIFQPNDEYRIYPDWEEARSKAVELLEKMVDFSKTNGELYIQKIYKSQTRELDQKEVMDIVLKEKNAKHSFPCYSNSDGLFSFDKPLQVVAIINTKNIIYIATKGDIDNCPDEGNGWYIQALQIVLETIDYVLAQPDKEEYFFHWSS